MSLSRVLAHSTAAVWGVMPDAIRNVLPRPRETRASAGGLQIALRTVGGPGTDRVARRLEALLLTLRGVERAEVNGALGSIFVGCEPGSVDLEKILSIIEEFDDGEDTDEDLGEDLGEEFDEDAEKDHARGSALSNLMGHHTRAGIRLGASLVGTGLAFAGRTVNLPPLSPVVPALLNLVECTPRIPSRDGTPSRSPGHQRRVLDGEHHRPYARAAPDRTARPDGDRRQPLRGGTRHTTGLGTARAETGLHERGLPPYAEGEEAAFGSPGPQPRGTVPALREPGGSGRLHRDAPRERQQAAGTRHVDHDDAQGRQGGTESFAAAVGRKLAKRGVIVINNAALRHMDGIDTVVLDADTLDTGSWTIDRAVPLVDDLDADELHARLYALIDFSDPGKRRENDSWVAEPLTDPTELDPEDAREWEARGLRPVGVRRQGAR